MDFPLRQRNAVAPIYPGDSSQEDDTIATPSNQQAGDTQLLPPLKHENRINKDYRIDQLPHNGIDLEQTREDEREGEGTLATKPPLGDGEGDRHSVVFANGNAAGDGSLFVNRPALKLSEAERGSNGTHKVGDGGGVETSQMTFYEAMKPLTFGMELFGLWHTSTIYRRSPEEMNARPTWRKIFNKTNYSIFVLALLWFNFIRFFPAFFTGAVLESERLLFKIIVCTVLLQSSLNATAMFLSTTRTGMMDVFFHHWEERVQSREETRVDLEWVWRWSKAFAIVAYIFIFLHFCNHAFGVFGPLESVRNATNVFCAPFESSYGTHTVFLILNIFVFAAWIFPIFLFIQVCIIMERQFDAFSKRFEKAMERFYQREGLPDNFEDLRYQHQELCFLVEASNSGLFTLFSAIAYTTMLPLACFMIYQLLFSFQQYVDNLPAIIMYVTWLTSVFVNVPVVSWMAALVNTKAHAPLESIYKVRAGPSASNQNVMQMNMFLARLNGAEVAYTVFDLIKLTKPFILTIAGVAVTYFALLIEFQN